MKIISTIFYVLFIGLIVGTAGLLMGTMLPIPGNIEMKIVKSGSMEPGIPTGSVVIVKPAADYRFNDIITFGADTRTEIPTTHRIIGVDGTGANATYITKGDANEEADQNPVARSEVIGKVVFSMPYAGYVLDFARQPLGFALLIGIPAALVILEELLTIARETRKWWRRRNGDDEGGSSSLDEPRTQYIRRRTMDEIYVPRVIQPSRLGRLMRSDAYGTSTMLVLGLMFVSFVISGASGGTAAYFQDIERSIANRFAAARCDDFMEDSCEPPAELQMAALALPEGEGAVLGETDEKEPETPPEELPEEPEESEGRTAPIEPSDEPAAKTAPIEPQEPATTPADDLATTAPIEPSEDIETVHSPENEPIPPAETDEPAADEVDNEE